MRLLSDVLLVAILCGLAQGQSIGINFNSNRAAEILPDEVAGYPDVAQSNWNNTNGAASGNESELIGVTRGTVIDSNGVATGMTLEWASNSTWNTNNGTSSGDNKLMSGYIDNTNPVNGSTFVRVRNIPYASYDVYLYFGSDTNGRTGAIAVPVAARVLSYSTNSQQAGGFPGAYLLTEDPPPGYPAANVSVFRNLTTSLFFAGFNRGSSNSGCHGIQIVSNVPPPDADNDGLPDSWETANRLSPTDDGSVDASNGPAGDPDADGSNNLEELTRGTDPQNDDSDADGLIDGVETRTGVWVSESDTGTNPRDPDSDNDTLLDGTENPTLPYDPNNPASQPGTDPNLDDTDGDAVSDGEEVTLGGNPTISDRAETYEQNFDGFPNGTTELGDGTVILGQAASVQGGRLQLTIDNRGLGISSFTIPGLRDSAQGWTATWDYELFDSAGDFSPADGFSFNYGDFQLGETGAAEEGWGNPVAGGSPSQVQTNLSFEVDTWKNFDAEQGVNISGLINGLDAGNVAFTNGPILTDGTRVEGTMTASYNAENGTVSFLTTGLVTNAAFFNIPLPAGLAGNDAFNFGFSARVGQANQDLFIDNLVITRRPFDPYQFGVSSPDSGETVEFEWNSSGSEIYTVVASDGPEENTNPASWAPVAGLENLAATPPLNTHSIARPAGDLRLFRLIRTFAPSPAGASPERALPLGTVPAGALVLDTQGSVVNDTEIGLYDARGNFIDTNDDVDDLGRLSRIRVNLAPGIYYVAAVAYNSLFYGTGFTVSALRGVTDEFTVNVRVGTNNAARPSLSGSGVNASGPLWFSLVVE